MSRVPRIKHRESEVGVSWVNAGVLGLMSGLTAVGLGDPSACSSSSVLADDGGPTSHTTVESPILHNIFLKRMAVQLSDQPNLEWYLGVFDELVDGFARVEDNDSILKHLEELVGEVAANELKIHLLPLVADTNKLIKLRNTLKEWENYRPYVQRLHELYHLQRGIGDYYYQKTYNPGKKILPFSSKEYFDAVQSESIPNPDMVVINHAITLATSYFPQADRMAAKDDDEKRWRDYKEFYFKRFVTGKLAGLIYPEFEKALLLHDHKGTPGFYYSHELRKYLYALQKFGLRIKSLQSKRTQVVEGRDIVEANRQNVVKDMDDVIKGMVPRLKSLFGSKIGSLCSRKESDVFCTPMCAEAIDKALEVMPDALAFTKLGPYFEELKENGETIAKKLTGLRGGMSWDEFEKKMKERGIPSEVHLDLYELQKVGVRKYVDLTSDEDRPVAMFKLRPRPSETKN